MNGCFFFNFYYVGNVFQHILVLEMTNCRICFKTVSHGCDLKCVVHYNKAILKK